VRKLGRNHGGYRGETIALETVLADLRAAARAQGWREELLPVPGVGALVTLQRPARDNAAPGSGPGRAAAPRVYLSAGIHGDEPAGPLAVRELFVSRRWPAALEFYVCPCLNPTGLALNRRENAAGVDLNRDYRDRRTPEVRAHTAWLERQPAFDLALCLHEDWEAQGFYLYELNPDGRPSAAERVVAAVAEVCPVDNSPVIDGRPARGGIIRPAVDLAGRPDWPEAFYLQAHKTRHGYTLEAPSDFPLATRVAALVRAVEVIAAAAAPGAGAQTVAGGPGAG
jgi:protein MpaA